MVRSRPNHSQTGEISPKPYALVPFPEQSPTLKKPIGHQAYRSNLLHGSLKLKLTVATAVHISTGTIVLGSDIGEQRTPLVKTMLQSIQQRLVIPGSSLKGVTRSVYEAITNSTVAVTSKQSRQSIPDDRKPCNNKERLCPAGQVFGALNWQGLIHFEDAVGQGKSGVGFMPSLYRPRPEERKAYFQKGKAAGRKFYYHATRAIDKGQQQGIPVQQANQQYQFITHLHFKNLSAAQMGVLLIILGQDPKVPIALKIGGGKPIGMGSMSVVVESLQHYTELRDRYLSYAPEIDVLTGQSLQAWMQPLIKAAHQQLIEQPQMTALTEILKYPTDREPPAGMY